MMGRSVAIRTAARAGASRNMSTQAPKMHKAKDMWQTIEAMRPKDPHPHVSVHPGLYKNRRAPRTKHSPFVVVLACL
jgi:hypothetical protein